MQCNSPSPTQAILWTIHQGRKTLLSSMQYLLRTFSHMWFTLSSCVCVCVCVCARARARTRTCPATFLSLLASTQALTFDVTFVPLSEWKEWASEKALSWENKRMTSLQTWTCHEIVFSSAPLCCQPGALSAPWRLHTGPASALLITMCHVSPWVALVHFLKILLCSVYKLPKKRREFISTRC
jgi:hypothetical protein